jgi:hypothetical protein
MQQASKQAVLRAQWPSWVSVAAVFLVTVYWESVHACPYNQGVHVQLCVLCVLQDEPMVLPAKVPNLLVNGAQVSSRLYQPHRPPVPPLAAVSTAVPHGCMPHSSSPGHTAFVTAYGTVSAGMRRKPPCTDTV